MQDFPDKSPPALRPSPDWRGTLNVAEETLEGSRISLANEDGTKLVSIYPKVSGSISDAQVQAEPENRWSSESRAKRLAA